MDSGPGRRAHVVEVLHAAAAAHEAAAGACLDEIVAAADLLGRALAGGGKVLAFGNGGSAADAQHLVAELVGRYEAGRPRRALPAIALSSDPSVVTAVANDTGFTQVFARQVEAFGQPGDVAVGLTTSGTSANVLAGLETARRLGLGTIVLTGRAAGLSISADVHIAVPVDRTPRVQEVHGTVLHVLCELIEEGM